MPPAPRSSQRSVRAFERADCAFFSAAGAAFFAGCFAGAFFVAFFVAAGAALVVDFAADFFAADLRAPVFFAGLVFETGSSS